MSAIHQIPHQLPAKCDDNDNYQPDVFPTRANKDLNTQRMTAIPLHPRFGLKNKINKKYCIAFILAF